MISYFCHLLFVFGQKPFELRVFLGDSDTIVSQIDAMPDECQGLLAVHGPALEEILVISRRPP